MRLEPEDIEAIAERVVERLTQETRPRVGIGLATAGEVAELYGVSVSVSWAYANKSRLGAVLLGDGPKARLRFDLERVARAVGATDSAPSARRPGRPRRHGLPAGVRLIEGAGK
jgi:hypothetical protein